MGKAHRYGSTQVALQEDLILDVCEIEQIAGRLQATLIALRHPCLPPDLPLPVFVEQLQRIKTVIANLQSVVDDDLPFAFADSLADVMSNVEDFEGDRPSSQDRVSKEFVDAFQY